MPKDLSESRAIRGVGERFANIPGGEICVSTIPPRAAVPAHHHAELQLGFALEGALQMTTAVALQRADRGRGYVVHPSVVHSARNEGSAPIRTFDLKLLLPGGGRRGAVGEATPARPSECRDRAGFLEFQFPFGYVRHRVLERGELLCMEPQSTGASYIAEVPVHGGDARIVAFKAPLRFESSGDKTYVVEVSLLPDAELVTECSRLEWRSDVEHRTCLLIEESDAARRTLRAQFEALGFATLEASSCCAGVRLAAEHYPELILFDVDAGGSDRAEEALACLASGVPLSKIVAMTGRGSLAGASSIIRRGAVAYLPKPTTAQLVLDSLRDPFDERRARRERPFTLSRASWEYLQQVLEGARSRAEAARRLGIQPRSLRRMLSKNAPPE
jgi:two-component system response regulator RegA